MKDKFEEKVEYKIEDEIKMLDDIFTIDPRNDWEREELQYIKDLYKFVYKDVRSIDAFCHLIYFYREGIAQRKLMVKELT